MFVNPTQFNNPDDLKKYPRTEENDIAMLEKVGVDAFIFQVQKIYILKKQKANIMILVVLKMKWRKIPSGHFDGVGTVVSELFRQVQPDNALFWRKRLSAAGYY